MSLTVKINSIVISSCIFGLVLLTAAVTQRLEVNEPCFLKDKKTPGICKEASKCTVILAAIKSGQMQNDDAVHCGYVIEEEVICCPMPGARLGLDERPAVRACSKFEENASIALGPNIVGGHETILGEFPHMAHIGFASNDNDKTYEFRCGGTLISEKFVLTAAHCLATRDKAKVVRLGLVDLTDAYQLSNAVVVPIKKAHVHDDYNSLYPYNDIALLELEHDVSFTENVAPTCLYTEDTDPDGTKLLATGYGVTELITRNTSKILLKAELEIVPLQNCNRTFLNLGRSLQSSQLCAYSEGKDSCQGDSGGPLNLAFNLDKRLYRVIGITSTGISCNTSIPSLYTRVSSYLDFIEERVWPDKKT